MWGWPQNEMKCWTCKKFKVSDDYAKSLNTHFKDKIWENVMLWGRATIVTPWCGCEKGTGGPVCWCTTLVSWRATKKMGSSSSSATTLCPSYCTLPIVCLQCLYFSAKLDQQARREASSGQLCSRPIATGLTAPLAHLRHNPGKIQRVINILVRSSLHPVMVGRGGI